MRIVWRHRSLALVLWGAFALRLAQLTFQPLWFDEGWSVWFGMSGLRDMLERTALDIHPPLYYALLHGWIAIAGDGEFVDGHGVVEPDCRGDRLRPVVRRADGRANRDRG